MTRSDASGSEEALVRSTLMNALPAALPNWLETRRWFADKGRDISGVEIEDALIEAVENDWLALAIARVDFASGDTARYLLPLALTKNAQASEIIVAAPTVSVAGSVVDATDAPWFGHWLIDAMARPGFQSHSGWEFSPQSTLASEFETARGAPATLMRAEQSNTSLRFGDALMVKLFRRLQPGPNPDEEMLRALADAGFARVPPYAGAASWHAANGREYPIALAQAFVPNLGDGWTWMLRRLEDVSAGAVNPELDHSSPEWLLGRRGAELHVALSQVDTPGFTPERASEPTISADVTRVQKAIRETDALLREREPHLPESLRTTLPETLAGLQTVAGRAEGFRDEAATRRIRVHGDYHLGQTLRTPDDDWTIIDFEGEPARPVAERRQKSSALKDVAGMLRSFAYARGVAERAVSLQAVRESHDRLSAWETSARRAFLDGYKDGVGAAPIPLVPADDEAFRNALAAWELDKALYEIAYEVRNRPDWLELPLRSLLPDLPGRTESR